MYKKSISTHLCFDCFLQKTVTAITMMTVTTTRVAQTHTATMTTVTAEGGSVGGAMVAAVQLSCCKKSITTGHVESTCSCVEATAIRGVAETQEVTREGMSTPGSAV